MSLRLFHATAAPADFVGNYYHSEPVGALAFSSQILDFARRANAKALLVSGHPDCATLSDGPVEIRHVPRRPAEGLRWRAEFVRHALRLLKLARAFKADAAVIDSGTMPHVCLELFRRSGMKVIPVFHNAMYPLAGASLPERFIEPFSRYALRKTAPISVSPAVRRQVGHGIEMRAQFERELFDRIERPRFAQPFNVLFLGRIEENKGIFDIVEAARICGSAVTWTICGDGTDLGRLKSKSSGLPIDVRGWASPEEQVELRSKCQAVVVPTKSSFAEGLAMTAVEAILSRRPLITNRAVPALELLRQASVEAEPDDARSLASAVLSLATNQAKWQSLVNACPDLEAPFLNREHGLAEALAHILTPQYSRYQPPSQPLANPVR